MNENIPSWKGTKISSLHSLREANKFQQQYYSILKTAFLNGRYLDVENNINYLHALIYDFENDFNQNHDYNLFSNRINVLVVNYPIMENYRNDTLTRALLDVIICNNNRSITIFKELVSFLSTEMTNSNIAVIPVNSILELLNCSTTDENSIYILNVQLKKILRGLGFGFVPNGEIENKHFTYGDLCVIYKIDEPITEKDYRLIEKDYRFLWRFSKKIEYKFIEVFIKLASKLVLEDEIRSTDVKSIDQFITCQLTKVEQEEIPLNVTLHLQSVARWRLSSKKPILDKSMKKFIEERLSCVQREIMLHALLRLACNSGYIRPKRIDSLKKFLPLFGIESENIHSLIHQILTDQEGFAVVEKKSDAIEYTINGQPTYPQQPAAPSVIINPKKLRIFEQQTKAAQELLSDIFVEEESTTPQNTKTDNTTSVWMEVLKSLLTKEVWERTEVETMCKGRGVMLGAVLEQINDFAYEKVYDAVIEDDGENIYVTMDYKEQLI